MVVGMLRTHLANNWGWYLFGGTVGGLGNYVYCSYASGVRRRELLDRIEDALPVNADELLELRTHNEVRAAQLLELQQRLGTGRRPKAVDGQITLSDFIAALPGSVGGELAEQYALERMLFAMSDNGREQVKLADATAGLMFVGLDSVDARMSAMFRAYTAPQPPQAQPLDAVPLEHVRSLLGALLATNQLPVEKRAREVKRPFYLPNNWDEVTVDVLMEAVPEADAARGALSEEGFKRFLCSNEVCIWGECYRLAEEEERRKAIELKAERERNPPWWAFWRSKPSAAEDPAPAAAAAAAAAASTASASAAAATSAGEGSPPPSSESQ